MSRYFAEEESIHYRVHDDWDRILGTIADRYIGRHSPLPYVFRAFSARGILNTEEDRRYRIDLNDKFADSQYGQLAYACSKLWGDEEKEIQLALTCFGPVQVYWNGRLAYQSTVRDEVEMNRRVVLPVVLRKGWNLILIRCVKTAAGFGCLIGAASPKWLPLNFHSPFPERDGQSGWIYSAPVDQDAFEEEELPKCDASEAATGLDWYPKMVWDAEHADQSPLKRIFGDQATGVFLAWSKVRIEANGASTCTFSGESQSLFEIWVNNRRVYSSSEPGTYAFDVDLSDGTHDVLVKYTTSEPDRLDFHLSASAEQQACRFVLPYPVKGVQGSWLYLGPLHPDFAIEDSSAIQTMHRVFTGSEGKTYWRADAPMTFIRPFLENELYGKWSYPLGVTLYGLLQTGRLLDRQDIVEYVASHVAMCVDIHEYALWDQEVYGYPGVNHQLCGMEALDDCGSFGSLMLEVHRDTNSAAISAVARIIADYMRNRQERREDGAFYRSIPDGISENTLWADDLYMSVPFLCRYYQLTGNREYIDDAAKQFLLFKKYLFMPEQRVMSHVYDFKRDTATNIPWGRGNGWVLFSLSELLAVLPEDHADLPDLLAFFRELSGGYAALQGSSGLWHQVVTDPDSYEETSCTSMFTYALARGIRFGWLPEQERSAYTNAVRKAWEGLTRISIDQYGNIHGVCRGSWYSFTAEYYKHELLWKLNDPHGIGIVMLAGIEVKKLEAFLVNLP